MMNAFECVNCGNTTFDTGKTIKADGSFQYWRRCCQCRKNWDGKFLKADLLMNKESLPVFDDYRQASAKCAVHGCTDNAVQSHHYLPQNIAARFSVMANDWPTGPLCHKHHVLWHWYVEGFKLDEKLLRTEGLI